MAEADLSGGSYEVVRARLVGQAKTLGERLDRLNERRKEVFGGNELVVVANERVRTEQLCIPRDILVVNGHLILGYTVSFGLKKETKVEHLFSANRFVQNGDTYDLGAVPFEEAAPWLLDPTFVKELSDVFAYFKDAKLLQLRKTDTRILAVFQIGATISDIKVFRFSVDARGRIAYLDARGEPDHVFPKAYDFEWQPVTREEQVQGRFPHLSIQDEIFVETTGGDLTIKVENNTETGRGIYSEPVADANQALDDSTIHWARVGSLILLSVLPFREDKTRYLVYNPRNDSVVRIDAIGRACRKLPEDQGLLFPGGFYLETGEHKIFDDDHEGLELERVIHSPNGEDVLYVFHRRDLGVYQLLPYNVIRKELAAPIRCNGFSIFEDGRTILFRALDEPTRVHPVQIWRTPFTSAEHAAQAPTDGSFLAKVGNAELVHGISDCFTVRRLVEAAEPSRRTYEELIKTIDRTIDAYYWLAHEETGNLKEALGELRRTAEAIVDEFEKVLALRRRAAEELAEATKAVEELVLGLRSEELVSVEAFMRALTTLRHRRGHLISAKETRYIDLPALGKLEAEVVSHFERVSRECVQFLLGEDALAPVTAKLDDLLARGRAATRVAESSAVVAGLDETSAGLEVVSEVVQGLEVDDATVRTKILESISELFSHTNRVRADVQARRKDLARSESQAEFAAQLRLLAQSVASGLALTDTPEKCDEALSRLMVQLEELEARFGELDELVAEIGKKREEIYDAFSGKKQTLLDARQRRAESLVIAANRIFEGVARRARTLDDRDDLNAYFASDAMIQKLRQTATQLRQIGDSVKADEIDARLLAAHKDALRGMLDKAELFEEGDLIRLGKHRFSVNTQPLELTMVPREEGMALHLAGTDFYELVDDEAFAATRDYWSQPLVSETETVYRAEYLAAGLLFDAEDGRDGGIEALHAAEREPGGLLERVRRVAASRYDEGYDRGVHDADATAILERLLALRDSAGLLRYPPTPRALACLYWSELEDTELRDRTHRRAMSLGRLRASFGSSEELSIVGGELGQSILAFHAERRIACTEGEARLAGRYLVEELMAERPRFVVSAEASLLRDALARHLEETGTARAFQDDLRSLENDLRAQSSLVAAWMRAIVGRSTDPEIARLGHAVMEAVSLVLAPKLDREVSQALTRAEVTGLLGQHPRIASQKMEVRLDELLERLSDFIHRRVPGYRAYRELRHTLLERERARLRLDEYKPRVMSSFVRNQLVNDVYLPLVGDNLAKQLGAAGEKKRTDLMGLLLLVSPPGYGKTTLMEYVANRLGLVFVKANGPALGHAVRSLDPAEAPNATSRQEVDKINLAFEMGNNVMLYLDDIQHTHGELLQKFISLCDAQRRVEGVWNGRTRTYDLRGKRFCVVMAGNPYTESGEKFQIPDMLANRADTYNLGEILEGRDDAFALSYVENALTSNAALSPLAARDQADLYKIVRMANGEEIPSTELSHGYAAAELGEMTTVLRHLFRVRDVLLRVNQEYIRSASQAESYRTEPPFKLQGSYRNMNKLAEKVVAAMNERELDALVDDHYQGESQTLTTGAEQNLLKLAELRGRMSDAQKKRWDDIKREFVRLRSQGGRDDDPVTRVTGTLGSLGRELEAIRATIDRAAERAAAPPPEADGRGVAEALVPALTKLEKALDKIARPKLEVKLEAPTPVASPAALDSATAERALAHQVDVLRTTILPLVESSTRNLTDARELHDHIIQLLDLVRRMDQKLREEHGL